MRMVVEYGIPSLKVTWEKPHFFNQPASLKGTLISTIVPFESKWGVFWRVFAD
jgi:hypothetical protein